MACPPSPTGCAAPFTRPATCSGGDLDVSPRGCPTASPVPTWCTRTWSAPGGRPRRSSTAPRSWPREHNEVNWSPRHVRSLRPAARRASTDSSPWVRPLGLSSSPPGRAPAPSPTPVLRSPGSMPPPVLAWSRPDHLRRAVVSGQGRRHPVDALATTDLGGRTVYLLGDGPMRGQLQRAIERHGLSGCVVMPGWVDEPWTLHRGQRPARRSFPRGGVVPERCARARPRRPRRRHRGRRADRHPVAGTGRHRPGE